jgi:hypothetical protein
MRHETVFEITQMPWEWWWSLCGLPFIAIGIYMIRAKRLWFYGRGVEPPKNPDVLEKTSSKLLSWPFLIFSLLWTVMALWFSHPDDDILRSGNSRVAEGVVNDCTVQPENNTNGACFYVDDVPFYSSARTVKVALAKAGARGFPIQKGVRVRVEYEGGVDTPREIYRLEVWLSPTTGGANGPSR